MATVKVELILNGTQLTSNITESDQVERFNKRDAMDFSDLLSKQREAKRFTHERKENNGKVPKTKRVHADDYAGEPAYAHPGIHLTYEHDDKLVFWGTTRKFARTNY